MFLFHNNVHVYLKILLNVYSRVKRHIGTSFVSIQVPIQSQLRISLWYISISGKNFNSFKFHKEVVSKVEKSFTMTFLTIENQAIVTALKISVMFTTMYVPFPKSVNEAQVTNVSRIKPSRPHTSRPPYKSIRACFQTNVLNLNFVRLRISYALYL